jgi:hypothetical protein
MPPLEEHCLATRIQPSGLEETIRPRLRTALPLRVGSIGFREDQRASIFIIPHQLFGRSRGKRRYGAGEPSRKNFESSADSLFARNRFSKNFLIDDDLNRALRALIFERSGEFKGIV